jgi:hypothetical protein
MVKVSKCTPLSSYFIEGSSEFYFRAYFFAKTAFDYAAMHKVMSEIHQRKKTRPKTILDFGSGIGSSIW